MKILIVTTETGSIYHVTPELRIWAQVKQGELVGPIPLRTTMGKYDAWSGARIGKEMEFIGAPLEEGAFRRIVTSFVTRIQETESE